MLLLIYRKCHENMTLYKKCDINKREEEKERMHVLIYSPLVALFPCVFYFKRSSTSYLSFRNWILRKVIADNCYMRQLYSQKYGAWVIGLWLDNVWIDWAIGDFCFAALVWIISYFREPTLHYERMLRKYDENGCPIFWSIFKYLLVIV